MICWFVILDVVDPCLCEIEFDGLFRWCDWMTHLKALQTQHFPTQARRLWLRQSRTFFSWMLIGLLLVKQVKGYSFGSEFWDQSRQWYFELQEISPFWRQFGPKPFNSVVIYDTRIVLQNVGVTSTNSKKFVSWIIPTMGKYICHMSDIRS